MTTLNAAFWRWFGDSVIRHPDGAPRIVYHGTQSPVEFDVFQTGTIFDDEGEPLITSSHDPSAFLGPNFTGSRALAEKFARGGAARWDSLRYVRGAPKGRVLEVFLRITHPIVFPSDEALWTFLFTHGESHEIDTQLEVESDDTDLDDLADLDPADRAKLWEETLHKLPDESEEGFSMRETAAQEIGESVRVMLQRQGYDGVVYTNTVEGGGLSYIVFEPTQIKSATANLGTWDSQNPSILAGRTRPRKRRK